MVVADAGAWNTGPDVGAALPYRDVWRSTFAERDAANAVFAEVDAHAFAQADAFADPESHALPFDSVSLASHYMAFGGWLRYSGTSRSACSSLSQPAHGFPWGTLKRFPRGLIDSLARDDECRSRGTPATPFYLGSNSIRRSRRGKTTMFCRTIPIFRTNFKSCDIFSDEIRVLRPFHTPELGFSTLFHNYGVCGVARSQKTAENRNHATFTGVHNVPKQSEFAIQPNLRALQFANRISRASSHPTAD